MFQISFRFDSGFIWWAYLLFIKHIPVYRAKEWVRLNVSKSCLWVTPEPFHWILFKKINRYDTSEVMQKNNSRICINCRLFCKHVGFSIGVKIIHLI